MTQETTRAQKRMKRGVNFVAGSKFDPNQADLFELRNVRTSFTVHVRASSKVQKAVRKADREQKAVRFLGLLVRGIYLLPETSKLDRPPFVRLQAFAEFVFTTKTFEHILQPRLAEAQIEYFEALKDQRFSKARWIRARNTIEVLWLMVMQAPVSLMKLIVKLWTVSGS